MDSVKFPLKDIQFVLLDMDGTLLDKYFDDYFWEHLVPEKYAEKHNITFGKAKDELMKLYRIHEGTLNWTDLDFWSKELDLDIPALKEQIRHLIEVHPHVEDFLKMLKRNKKKIFLVTNAHYKAIDLKLKKTRIGKYFDSVLSSFDAGSPKESLEFWREAEKRLGFDKEKTLLIDDSEEILTTAKKYGLAYVLYKAKASSNTIPKPSKDFLSVFNFNELMDES
ncbi:MAG: HAD-IA family hydrolase [Nitrospirae bacterium]|jgi:HAD superfamily hydrolase (TIGR01509 family)|nr:HAD-IA family hydrolase [Nitrospirota bacterium]